MAQRAYRQRKESTLDDLRKRVSELANTLELMNKTFTELRDHMSGTANEDQLKELWDASGQYEALMKIARNPGEEDFEPSPTKHHSLVATPSDEAALPRRRNEPINVPSWLDQAVLNEAEKRGSPDSVGMGYTIYPGEIGEDQPVDDFALPEQNRALVQKQPPLTVYDALTSLLPDDIRIPRQLPTITTYSFQESSFARRLHRACLETAYHMLLDPERRQKSYERIFRLSLMGNDISRLTTSLKAVLARGAQESLYFWEDPLIHVGGAGTHYPRRDLNGILQTRKSTYNLGLVGPQTLALLESAAKNNLSTDMTVEIAGYEGEWFDPYDVEGYLEERGIRVDPNQSFVEAEIDDENTSTYSSAPATPTLEFSFSHETVNVNAEQVADLGVGNVEMNKWTHLTDTTFTGVGYSDAVTGDWMNFIEPGQGVNWLDSHTQASPHTQNVPWADGGTTEILQALDHSSFRPPPRQLPPTNHRAPRKKNVIIDTSKLVKGWWSELR
ncbi:hypothetical protein B0A55_06510 [Friedmanniomyces simplex]|uniref:BZIP domain-containing protein n=1 Tax=Friedmanniomyces simplex TaxID=329884 RepID=A0A4U0XDR2_9PEZI|nr:hypothetical protein B0A55_06510 [Friedmanniomyces simplex]